MSAERIRLEQLLSRQERRVQDAFRRYVRDATSPAVMREIIRFLEAGNVTAALGVLESHIARMAAVIPAIVLDTAAREALALQAVFSQRAPSVAISFDPGNPRAADLLRQSRLQFIQDFTASQRQAVSMALSNAQARGAGPRAVAAEFRGSIGLTPRLEGAVANYRRLLEMRSPEALARDLATQTDRNMLTRAIERDRALTPEQIDRMVNRYRQRALQYRSEVIARTESTRAVSEAREEALDQALEQTGLTNDQVIQTWRSVGDGRVRETHAAMDGMERPRGEPFQSPSGALLRYPGDPDAPPEEVIACRCNVEISLLSDRV